MSYGANYMPMSHMLENEGGYMLGGYMLGGAKKEHKKGGRNLKELKEEAKKRGLKGFSKMKKAHLEEALKNPELHKKKKVLKSKVSKTLLKSDLEHVANILVDTVKILKSHAKKAHKLK